MTQEQLKLLVRYIQLKLDEHQMAESSDHGLAERVRASNVLDKLEALCDNHPARDWPEDAADENGKYQNECAECGEAFIGHKRRHLCKVCANSVDRIKQAQLDATKDAMRRAAHLLIDNRINPGNPYNVILHVASNLTLKDLP